MWLHAFETLIIVECLAAAVAVRDSLHLLLFAASWLQTSQDCFATSANPFKGERGVYLCDTEKCVVLIYTSFSSFASCITMFLEKNWLESEMLEIIGSCTLSY